MNLVFLLKINIKDLIIEMLWETFYGEYVQVVNIKFTSPCLIQQICGYLVRMCMHARTRMCVYVRANAPVI
jgi:hypothetical protein